MIFADKLILLRKKAGWSQEELAHRMDVTRQSVSKWEGMQAVPDLDKMIRLSELFGVSLDYLLKDEIEEVEDINSANSANSADDTPPLKRVTMPDKNNTNLAKTPLFPCFSANAPLKYVQYICTRLYQKSSKISAFWLRASLTAYF